MVRENWCVKKVREKWCVKNVREKWCVKKVREYSKSGAERLRENCVKKGA